MRSSISSKLRDISYTISSNLINMLVSMVAVMLVPKFIGVTQYSYLQFYIFISSYITLFTFGWTDGISLRYTGKSWDSIQNKFLPQQFVLLMLVQLIACGLLIALSFSIKEPNKQLILQAVGIFTFFVNTRYFFVHIAQAISDFKSYSLFIIIDRLVYVAGTIGLICLNVQEYQWFIVVDLLSKFISLAVALVKFKGIFSNCSKVDSYLVKRESWKNIRSGSKMIISSTTSMLIIGIVRLFIERMWSIETFGKLSLTINLSNFILVFISAIGLVLFPIFRKMTFDRLKSLYFPLALVLNELMLVFLLLYFPIGYVLSAWLPMYKTSIFFMGLIFPICISESMVSLLITPTLKALRLETRLLQVNVGCFALSVACCILNYLFFKNLIVAALTITLVLFIRAILGNCILMKKFNTLRYDIFLLHFLGMMTFILGNLYFSNRVSVVIYSAFLLVSLIVLSKQLKSAITQIKSLILRI
ncbi:oligosaccharide flippase family protein [Enterococcus sp. DIV0756]|uniref:oligosaccharide flippase family protein n=1 Tax=Enterococcus sp. DIV0756 TaxID=2774636 RepID=UPI003F28B285